MRTIIVTTILFLSACLIVGQIPNEEAKKDLEFQQLITKSKATQEENKIAIKEADKKTSEIITKTANQIVSLKNEVKQLKSELNEANKKIDSTVLPDVDIPFQLFSIPNSKENG
jgi:TolA-binding protein